MALRHDAFISYSHAADGPLAAALERGLEKLSKPLLRLRAMDVFRDQTSLTAAPALWPGIVAHLEASGWFLLLASPHSAASVWCNKEVQWWLDHRSPDRMLVLLTDGEIVWDRAAQDFDWQRTSSLPRLLGRRCADEPLYVDVRWARGSDLLTLRNPRFREAVVSIAAPMRGLSKDELDGEDLRQLARNRRFVRGGVAAIAVAAVMAIWQAFVANQQRAEAERQRDIAVARQFAAQAELMRVQEPDRLPLAMLMAAAAVRAQPESLEAQQTLRGLLARVPTLVQTSEHSDIVHVARISPDLERLATAAAGGGGLWSVKDGRRIASLPGADRSVEYSKNGESIAGCCAQVAVWNGLGEEKLRLSSDELQGRAENVAISPTGQTLAVGLSGDGWIGVDVYEFPAKRLLLRRRTPGEVRGIPIAYAANGDFVTAVGDDVEWYAAGRWENPRTLDPGGVLSGRPIERLAVSPNGQRLAISSRDETALIALTPPATPILLRKTAHGPFTVETLVFDAGSRFLGAVPEMGPATIWRVSDGREVVSADHGDFFTVRSLSFSPTHPEALTCATDGNCFTWSLSNGLRIRQFSHVYAYEPPQAGSRVLGAGEHATRGPLAVTSGSDRTARVWQLTDAAREPRERCPRPEPVYSTYIALSRSWNVIDGPRDSAESTCDPAEGPADRPAQVMGTKDLIAFTVADGLVAAATRGTGGSVLRVWAEGSAEPRFEQTVPFPVGTVKLAASGTLVVATGESPVVPERLPLPAGIAIWNLAEKRLVLELPKADGTIALDVARDGTRVAAVSAAGLLRVWHLPGGSVQQAVLAAPGPVAFSADGRWLAAGGNTIRIFATATMAPVAQIDAAASVRAIGFHERDTLLAVRHYAGAEGEVLDRFRWQSTDLLAEACARLPRAAAAAQWRQLLPDQPIPAPCAGS